MNNISHIEIYSLPFDDRDNRYFSLWREALEQTGRVRVKAVPRGGLLQLAFSLGDHSNHLLIVHWSTALYGSRFALKSIIQLLLNSIALSLLKIRGWTLFWVMHNASAHDYPHPLIDRLGRALIRAYANAVIVHQESTREMLLRSCKDSLVVHIPHGHYRMAYQGHSAEPRDIRKRYGFNSHDHVFLALGMIRPYKQLEKIIEAFNRLPPYLAGTEKLLIIGKGDPSYVESLQAKIIFSGIQIENRFVPDEELPALLAASSYSVFFYDDSELTSGGIILSLSYGVPIISRRIPAAEMVHEGQNGFFFDSVEKLSVLIEHLAKTIPPSSDQVFKSSDLTDWESVAHSYVALYDSLYE